MNHIINLLQEHNYHLNPPASETDISACEGEFACTLDPTWKEILLSANGASQYDENNTPISQWISCADIRNVREYISAFLVEHFGDNWQQRKREDIADGLANTLLHPLWLPFFRNSLGQIYCLDHSQHPASVIELFPDEIDGDYHVIRVADNLEQWLENQHTPEEGLNNENLLELVEDLMNEYGMLDNTGEFQSSMREYNLYDHIGLHIHSQEAFLALCEQLQHQPLSAVPCAIGTYYIYQESATNGGLCLSVLVDQENNILSLTPYFIGHPQTILAYHYIQHDTAPHNGICYASLSTSEAQPFSFNVANFAYQQNTNPLPTPQTTNIHLSAFVQNIECYTDEEEYSTTNTLALNHLIPSEHLNNENKEIPLSAQALLCGTLQHITLHTNPLSGLPYYHLSIRTQHAIIDLLCHPDLLPQAPQPDSIIQANVFLIGNFIQ